MRKHRTKLAVLFLYLVALAHFIGCAKPDNSLKLDLSNSVGLVLWDSTSSRSAASFSGRGAKRKEVEPSLNLDKVNEEGVLSSTVVTGAASISKIFIASNRKLYLLFTKKIDLETSEASLTGCLLAEVEMSSGVPVCIDSTLKSVEWSTRESTNPPIQLDSRGAIFYKGKDAAGTSILRKYEGGTTEDLISDSVVIHDFIVNRNGSVILSGLTSGSKLSWTRLITRHGSLESIFATESSSGMYRFPDGDVYLALSAPRNGIWRYNTEESELRSEPFLGSTLFPTDPEDSHSYDPEFWVETEMSNMGACRALCISHPTWLVTTDDGQVFGVNKTVTGRKMLFRYYPTPSNTGTSIVSVAAIGNAGDSVIVAGLDSTKTNRLVRYFSDDRERDLLGDREIEVYNINVRRNGKLMFDGLDFKSNRKVIGEVDLETYKLKVTEIANASAATLVDFKTID